MDFLPIDNDNKWQSRAECYLVIGSEVVDLLLENTGPKVFTDELHDVQLIFEPRCVFCQPV